jgi:membrane protein insertase Oxa1/YidC/SpoIIIJ
VKNAQSFDSLLEIIGSWDWYAFSMMPGFIVSMYLDVDLIYGACLSIIFYTLFIRLIFWSVIKLIKRTLPNN